ncbi:MAG: DUF2934 domain-containing protein [Bacteroidales bacterium]|nr:MAG: DUF2934 domain-containing protein [Bacteroidales bacterium]
MATKKKATAKTSSSGSKKSTVKAKSRPASSRKKKITENDIRKRAEKIYNERVAKGIPGDSESDWLQAEKELKGLK